MRNFINVGGIYLNLDHVKVIIDHEDGTCTVITDDGERYTNIDYNGLDFQGTNVIRSVFPCTGISARMERDGQEFVSACSLLVPHGVWRSAAHEPADRLP